MKLQFRLRTLMIVVTLLAVPLGYVGWQAKIVRERKIMLKTWVIGTEIKTKAGNPTLLRSWLGDKFFTQVNLHDSSPDETVEQFKRAFPEAIVTRFPHPRSGPSLPQIDYAGLIDND